MQSDWVYEFARFAKGTLGRKYSNSSHLSMQAVTVPGKAKGPEGLGLWCEGAVGLERVKLGLGSEGP